MNITLGQLPSLDDKEKVLEEIERVVESTDADLVVFPEGVMHDFRPRVDLAAIAEPLDGRFVTRLRSLASTNGRALVAGIWEPAPTGRVFNTVVTIDAAGSLTTAYRKIHLFDSFGFAESGRVEPGPIQPAVVDLLGTRMGIMTCYDLRFPELARRLSEAGAEMFVIPAGWVAGEHKVDHWLTLLRARAIENTTYVVAACLSQPWYTGHSTVFDPMGIPLATAGEDPAEVRVEIDLARVAEVRSLLPSLQHRRM